MTSPNSNIYQVATLLPPTLLLLDLGGCARLSDPGVQAIALGCPRLSSLSLARTNVTDLGLSRLGIAQCRNFLHELKVDGCKRLTDLGVELLLDGLSRLQILSFHSCPGVTERAREALEVYLGQGRVRQLTWTVYWDAIAIFPGKLYSTNKKSGHIISCGRWRILLFIPVISEQHTFIILSHYQSITP